MPLSLKQFDNKWKVCDPNKCFSKTGLTKKQAQRQRVAVAIASSKKEHKPMKSFFV